MAKDMLTFDAGDLSDDQLMTVMAVANIAKARMDAVEKGCKAVLVGRMETGHRPAMLDGEELADIQRTAGGGDGEWVVKDAAAYGAWLDRQEGMEDFVRRVPMPTADAMDPDSWDPRGEDRRRRRPRRRPMEGPGRAAGARHFKDKGRALEALERRPATVERLLGATAEPTSPGPGPGGAEGRIRRRRPVRGARPLGIGGPYG